MPRVFFLFVCFLGVFQFFLRIHVTLLFVVCLFVDTGSCYAAQAGLLEAAVCLPQPPAHWDYRCSHCTQPSCCWCCLAELVFIFSKLL